MSLYILDRELYFPPVETAGQDGLLAVGGDLSVERLLLAYKKGIFPWFDGDIPMWWSPDPRFVLYPGKLKVSHSMKQLLKQQAFRFTVNTAFEEVINYCSKVPRNGQHGTWITREMINAYIRLHVLGVAMSAEVWRGDQLVGGLYGITTGKVFSGESMFSLESNASKFALISFIRYFLPKGLELIDCQVHTPHLESLGAELISRGDFLQFLK